MIKLVEFAHPNSIDTNTLHTRTRFGHVAYYIRHVSPRPITKTFNLRHSLSQFPSYFMPGSINIINLTAGLEIPEFLGILGLKGIVDRKHCTIVRGSPHSHSPIIQVWNEWIESGSLMHSLTKSSIFSGSERLGS